ncbi:MAG: hypothetical protein KDH96_11085 [Candidatus Riesia sp.]|nr:hypothetical protein [Candidatus Riesia sp.]
MADHSIYERTLEDLIYSSKNMKIEQIKQNSFPAQNKDIQKNHHVQFRLLNSIVNLCPIIKYACSDLIRSHILFCNDINAIYDTPEEQKSFFVDETALCINLTQLPLLIPDKITDDELEDIVFRIEFTNNTDDNIYLTSNSIKLVSGNKKYQKIIPENINIYKMYRGSGIVINDIIILSRTSKDSVIHSPSNIKNYLGAMRKTILGWDIENIANGNKTLAEVSNKDKFNHIVYMTTQGPMQPRTVLLEAIDICIKYLKNMTHDDKEKKIVVDNVEWDAMEFFIILMFILYMEENKIFIYVDKFVTVTEIRYVKYEILQQESKSKPNFDQFRKYLLDYFTAAYDEVSDKITLMKNIPKFSD